MKFPSLLLGILLTFASSGTGAQEIEVEPDGPLPNVGLPFRETDVIIMSPAERATIACLQATNKAMAISAGEVIEITIGLPTLIFWKSWIWRPNRSPAQCHQ